MNERLKELAEQAKEYADTKYSKLVSTSRWGDSVPGIRELYTEKLAELLIQECMQVAKEYQNRGGNCYVDNMIAEHFGVEL